MQLILLSVLFLVSFVSCGKENTVMPEKLFMKLIPSQRFVRVNDSISFSLYIENHENFQLDYEWTADKGTVAVLGRNGRFFAPATKDDVKLLLKATDQYGRIYKDSVIIKVFNQLVILKADDLVNDSKSIFPERWDRFIEYIDEKGIKASIGIIGNSLASGNQAYFNRIKEYHLKGNIEFWNHGYDHLINGINEKGEKYHEFKNSPLAYQKSQIEKAQSLAKKNLGFYFRSFGAPANGIDSNTLLALEADSTIKVWFYGDAATTKLNLARHPSCEIEYPVHNPDFEKLKQHYDPVTDLLVLQIHPNSWDEIKFSEFFQVVDHLITNNATFINPYEYYKLTNNVWEEIIF
ncbi:MAG: DUF2334 domain-containing protein [Bacteroidota bacterium]|nr:DUF2334 domain-containing protein [Bacteroidota bacterium]